MPQPDHISALPVPEPAHLDADIQAVYQKCVEKLGLVPNVLRAYSFHPQKLRNFMTMYNELMLGDSKLSKLEREMVAVVVSSANRCYYCLVAHGQAVRRLSDDAELGEMMALNYRVAKLDARQRARLDFKSRQASSRSWPIARPPYSIITMDSLKSWRTRQPARFWACILSGRWRLRFWLSPWPPCNSRPPSMT